MCVCSSRYAACYAHAPYCHVWAVRLYFFHIIHEQHDFRKKKKVTEHKICVPIYSTTVFSATFLILRITERDIIKVYVELYVQ